VSAQIEDGGPAFPWGGEVRGGMSLRAYFIAHAEPLPSDTPLDWIGKLGGRDAPTDQIEYWRWYADAEARWKVMQADAMLAAMVQR
jgi:hypothetical protein